jgi:hypothetical protein
MGYANELGESFKASISRGLYVGTYAVAIAYALGDALDKGLQAHHRVQYEHEAAARKDAVDSRCEYLSMPVPASHSSQSEGLPPVYTRRGECCRLAVAVRPHCARRQHVVRDTPCTQGWYVAEAGGLCAGGVWVGVGGCGWVVWGGSPCWATEL